MLRTRVAPAVRALRQDLPGRAVWFERANKPDWSLQVWALGEDDWLGREAGPALAEALGVGAGEARFVDATAHDKWTGGGALAGRLAGLHGADALACLDALEADQRGELGSRAHFNLRVVESLLDALALHGDRRMTFYRDAFDWAVRLGRWDG